MILKMNGSSKVAACLPITIELMILVGFLNHDHSSIFTHDHDDDFKTVSACLIYSKVCMCLMMVLKGDHKWRGHVTLRQGPRPSIMGTLGWSWWRWRGTNLRCIDKDEARVSVRNWTHQSFDHFRFEAMSLCLQCNELQILSIRSSTLLRLRLNQISFECDKNK